MSAWTGPGYGEGWTVPGYLEERQVGQGASGRVVAAVSEVTGQRVAIKYLSPSLARDPSFMFGFRSEAQTLRALDVPQVVQLYDYVEAPGQGAAIVMELVDGVSLHEMISERGATTAESALAALKGSLLGLAAAHGLGIVHRDYKPENVLVDSAGNSKLSDFGVATRTGKKSQVVGTPLYMAPEQWTGAPSSPATDVYAATAVFYECLTAKPPFSGKLGQLRAQHIDAPVPLDGVDESLHPLIMRGMAKHPEDRPPSAVDFVAELESTASAAYGPDWEERGRSQLAERVAALLPLLLLHGGTPGSSGTSVTNTWLGGKRPGGGNRQGRGKRPGGNRQGRGKRLGGNRRILAATAVAAVVVVSVGAVATAVEVRSHNANLKSSSQLAAITPTYTAQAAVTPPVRSEQCKTPVTFAFSGIITATAPGTVSYRWVYSSGQQGPVKQVTFAAAGDTQVAGDTVSTKVASAGWGEIKVISPAGKTSNQASYKLLCTGAVAGFSAAASVQPSTFNAGTCGTTPPKFTATGSVTSPRAATVTYYWALSSGQDSAPATVTLTKAGTMAVAPMTITPPGEPASGQAVLVVTSPQAVASGPATYSLTCNAPGVTSAAKVSPATQALSSCTAAAPTFTFTGSLSVNQAGTVTYHWHLPNGDGPTRTLAFAAAGTKTVTAATYKPASDTASGSGSIIVTSPKAVASNSAAFKLTCGLPLSVATSGAATATIGTAYSATATAAGGKGSYKWAAATGLPPGLTTAANAGKLTISGTPTKAGAFTVKLSVSDGSTPARTATASLTVTVSAPSLAVTAATLAAGTVNVAYSATVTATGGTGARTWSATGLPAGLAIGATTGTISGTPTATGTSTITVTVTDSASPAKTATGTFTLTVNAPPLTLAGGTLASGQVRVAYSATVTASGGTGTKTYTASGLPGGLTMSSAGTISGVPSASGSFNVTVTVTDSGSPAKTATGTYTITIAPPIVISSSPTPTTSTPPPVLL
jgi:tRNA A-37 threonylcarbamoyl transferase component Bud32